MKHTHTITKDKKERILTVSPACASDGTLSIRFKGSRGWKRAHPDYGEPVIKTECEAGQTVFAYPKGLKASSIVEITSE